MPDCVISSRSDLTSSIMLCSSFSGIRTEPSGIDGLELLAMGLSVLYVRTLVSVFMVTLLEEGEVGCE